MILRLNPELRRISGWVTVMQTVAIIVGITVWIAAGVDSKGTVGDNSAILGAGVAQYAGFIASVALIACVLTLEVILVKLLSKADRLREERGVHEVFRIESEAAFTELRAQRHDFLAHAGAIQYMLEANQSEEASTYLTKLVGEYDRVNTGLRGEKAHLAAMLLQAEQRAERQGVRLTLDLEIPLSALPMKTTDQSRLIANVLGNALDAAESAGTESAWGDATSLRQASYVKVTSLIGGGLYVLEVGNSTEPLSSELADRLFLSYGTSTKGGDHRGIGTYIIASLVEQYNGRLEFSAVKDRFWLKIKVPVVT